MAYSHHVVRRDVAPRGRGLSRKILVGCAFGAFTLAGGLAAGRYVDFEKMTRGARDAAPAPAAAATAPAPVEMVASSPLRSLFDPQPALGVTAGGFAPRLALSAPAPQSRAPLKPTPMPDADEADEAAQDTADAAPAPPLSVRAPQLALVAPEDAEEPEDIAPAPPRRPVNLALAAPSARLARGEPQTAPAAAPTVAPPTAPLAASNAAPTRSSRRDQRRAVLARRTPDEPSFFQKLFGGLSQPAAPGGALAYAPSGSLVDNPVRTGLGGAVASLPANPSRGVAPRTFGAPRLGGGRAIYDISSATVYMPDGTRLEAHSGLGAMRDNPRYAHVRMRGVTPPHVYNLREREALFHGVRAIRLTPVGGSGAIHGRAGLLAHTYMLGPNGDSNGCVSIRNYRAFLDAFLAGQVSQLVVVDSMSNLDRIVAMR
jgi:hypothetical protein